MKKPVKPSSPIITPAAPAVRRPPLRTEDVKRLLVALDGVGDAVGRLDGYNEVAAAIGHEPPAPVVGHTCTVCMVKFTHEPIHGEFCSTKCEDWAFDNPDKPPYAPKGGNPYPRG